MESNRASKYFTLDRRVDSKKVISHIFCFFFFCYSIISCYLIGALWLIERVLFFLLLRVVVFFCSALVLKLI